MIDDDLLSDPVVQALSLLRHSARVSPVLRDAVNTVAAALEARREVPVRWCTVHNDEDYGMDDGRCGIAWATVGFDRLPPDPCHLSPCYITEDTPA